MSKRGISIPREVAGGLPFAASADAQLVDPLTKCPAPLEVGLTARSGSRHRFGPQSTSDLPLVPQGRYV